MNKENNLNHADVGNDISPIWENTFPKFELTNILEMKMPKIVVKKIDDSIEIEDTHIFKMLLSYFNKIYWINLSTEDLLYSRSSFNAFMTFVLNCILKRYMIINKECEHQFMNAIEKLRSKYLNNLRSIDKYYDEIIRTIFRSKWLSKKNIEVRDQMYLFDQAYSLMKVAFKDEQRESGERYFEHLKGVMEILLRELPNPNLNKIIIALLHDVQEDLPEYADAVRVIYGNYIADWVDSLSKKNWTIYLNSEELILYERCIDAKCKKDIEEIAKERKNQDYFWHLDQLNDDYLDVKLADRINNLRDTKWLTREKAIRKVQETEKYFLHIALERNKVAHDLMIKEIKKNKEKLA